MISNVSGLLLVISGPSGVGKGTLCRLLRREMPDLVYSISATTRPARPGETDGQDYYFLDRQRFEVMLAAGSFLEWAQVYGNYYGTLRQPVEAALGTGRNVLLEIDTQGAAQVRRSYPGGVSILILPPSLDELERRIRGRGTESEEVVRRRLQAALGEIREMSHFSYAVVNDSVESALNRLQAIVLAETCRTSRLKFNLEG